MGRVQLEQLRANLSFEARKRRAARQGRLEKIEKGHADEAKILRVQEKNMRKGSKQQSFCALADSKWAGMFKQSQDPWHEARLQNIISPPNLARDLTVCSQPISWASLLLAACCNVRIWVKWVAPNHFLEPQNRLTPPSKAETKSP